VEYAANKEARTPEEECGATQEGCGNISKQIVAIREGEDRSAQGVLSQSGVVAIRESSLVLERGAGPPDSSVRPYDRSMRSSGTATLP
jgi:hypothetical protein